MRKIYLVSLVLLLVSCSQDNIFDSQITESNKSIAIKSDESAQACEIASQLRNLINPSKSRSTTFNNLKAFPVLTKESRSLSSDTLFYVVEYGNEDGFAIISLGENTSQILGYVEDGSFFDIKTTQNPGFQKFINAAVKYVESSIEASNSTNSGLLPIEPAFRTWTVYYNDSIPAKIKVKWGQRYPEGIFCPNGLSGCVQTAMAQACSYMEEPKSIKLTFPEKPYNTLGLNWPELKKHTKSISSNDEGLIRSHLNECDASEVYHEVLGLFCRELGYRNDAVYGYDANNNPETGAYLANANSTFKNILPSNLWIVNDIKDYTDIMPLIDGIADGIVLMSSKKTNHSIGHAWVADGAIRIGTIVYTTYYHAGIDGSDVTVKNEKLNLLVHYNWGWRGWCDGYFLPDVFLTDDAYEYDQNGYPYPEYRNLGEGIQYFTIRYNQQKIEL